MAKTLDDLYSKLDDIAKALSSINSSVGTNSNAPTSINSAEMDEALKKELEEIDKKEKADLEKIARRKELYNEIKNIVKEVHNSWEKMEDQAYKTGRAMGYNGQSINSYFRTQLKNTVELGNELGITYDQLNKLQTGISQAINRTRTLTTEQMRFVGAMSKLTSESTITEVISSMDKLGASSETAMARLAKGFNDAGKFGLNAAKSSEAIAKNLKYAATYSFKGGTSELAKMVIETEKMKINFESIARSSEKFNTLEDAISTSANIQVLGGSFGREFTNPLEVMYEATSDVASYMKRIERVMEGKGVYNKKTGEVEFDPVTRQMIAAFSKQVGISMDELMTMASSKITHGEIENAVKNSNLGKEQLEYLKASAFFNQETQKWVVNKLDKKGDKIDEVDIASLSNEDIKEIQRNTSSEENSFKDIASIREYVAKLAGETASFAEKKEGAKSTILSYASQYWDYGGQVAKSVLPYLMGGYYGYKMIRPFTKKLNPFTRAEEDVKDRAKKARDNARKGGSPSSPAPEGSSGSGKNPNASNNPKEGSKILQKAKSKLKGKGKLIGGGIAVLAGLAGLAVWGGSKSSNSNEPQNNDKQGIDVDVDVSGNPMLQELQKQTKYLEQMSGNLTNNQTNGGIEANSEENITPGAIVGDTLTGLVTDPYIATSIGKKVLTKTAPNIASKIGLGATSSALAGPLGWGGLAVDGVNILGQSMGWWQEGGAVDKTLNIGSGMATGAAIGSMIVPGVGTAVGAAVGGLIAASDDLKEGLQTWDRTTNKLLDSDSVGENILGGLSWVGQRITDAIGGNIVRLFGESNYDIQKEAWEEQTKATREQQEAWESNKLGQTTIQDPMLQQKAALATVKIHDQLITWYRAYMGLNSDATGDVEDLKKVNFDDIYEKRIKETEGYNDGGIVGGTSYSGDKVLARVNSGEMILNRQQQSHLYNIVATNDIKAKEIVGQPQYISPSAPSPSSNLNVAPQNSSVNVNVNGTLRLESNGNSMQIDMGKLLDNPQFKQQIINMVQEGINARSNGNVRVNRDSVHAKSGGAIGKSVQAGL